ncbi:nonselective cation channel [Apiospora arundinis]
MSDFHLFSPKSFELGRSNSGSPLGPQNPRFEDYESSIDIDLETASNLRPDSQRNDSGSNNSSRTSSVVDSPSVYKTIHRVRRLVIATLDDPYTLDQLREPRMNIVVVRPLVNRLYDPDDPWMVYCLLANRIQFLREQSSTAHQTVSIARAALCELVATRILRRFHEEHSGPIGLLLLSHILVNGFDPFQGAPTDIELEHRHRQWPIQKRHGEPERRLTALELAIISESKVFVSSFACQKVIDAVYEGRVVYTPISFVDILPDHYESCPISLYDPRQAPFLDQTRLTVPRVRNIIELSQFLVLVCLYILTMMHRSSHRATAFEYLFCIYATGWCVDEFAAMIDHGWAVYSQTLWSFLDIAFIVIFGVYAMCRVHDGSIGSMADGYGMQALCVAAPILLTRLAFATIPDNIVFISIYAMLKDFTLVTFLAIWCFTGFLLSLLWLNSSASAPDENPAWATVCKWLLWIWFGLDGTGIDHSAEFHPILGPALMTAFAFLGNTLFLTIMVAVLTNIFSKIIADAPAEIQFRRAVLTFAGVKSDAIFSYPPPFNLVALLFMLPLKAILTPLKFHELNVLLIRTLNAPTLLVIGYIERRRARGGGLHRSRKSSLLRWNFSGFSPHGDIQAVFKAAPPEDVQTELEELDALSDVGYAESELLSPRSLSRRRTRQRRPRRGSNLPTPPAIFPLSSAVGGQKVAARRGSH